MFGGKCVAQVAILAMVCAGMGTTIVMQAIQLQQRDTAASPACPRCIEKECPAPPPPSCPPPPPAACPPPKEGGGGGSPAAGRALGAVNQSQGSWKEVRWWRGPEDWVSENGSLRKGDPNFDVGTLWTSIMGLDRILVDIFDGKRGGYFVDLGASFGWILSNTATLEQEYGWRGLCVEAAYEDKRMLPTLIERRCDVAFALVGAYTGEKLRFRIRSVLSGITRGTEFHNKEGGWWAEGKMHFPHKNKTAIALTKLLDDFSVPRVVDVMKSSMTGSERWVFNEFDWDKYQFQVGLFNKPPRKLVDLLKEKGYDFVARYGEDFIFVHTSFERYKFTMKKYYNASSYNQPLGE